MGYTANLNEEALKNYSTRLMEIAEQQGRPKGAPVEYDLAYYQHQVPGGMVTTLKRQLSEAGKADRLEEVIEEISRVREELGYPIMVTPLSQFVATQATLNVISGERYKVIPDSIIEYIAGYHGAPPAAVNQAVLDKIYRLPKAKKILEEEFPQPSVAEIRRHMGIGPKVSDEEFLLRYALSEDEVNAMLAADPG
jgi:oxaloacetate decarboxylase alpha subunit